MKLNFSTTEEIEVPKMLIDQVIGQEKAVEIIKKAAQQKRHVLLLGAPGTGKSMLGQAMAELLPAESLEDTLVYPNEKDPQNPKILTVVAGQGKRIIEQEKQKELFSSLESRQKFPVFSIIFIVFLLSVAALIFFKPFSDVIIAALIILGGLFTLLALFGAVLMSNMKIMSPFQEVLKTPRILVDNSDKKTAPFVDATGAHAGALLGDCLHDPYQSGGLGTPPHARVIAGAIHKAHKGVLFIDEIATLSLKSQQELLTAMQEKKYPITGQSELSSGAMVKTDPVPCDFLLVAAGNLFDLQKMHPALRSRIRGYGYEVYLNDSMPDTPENRAKLARFVAQEVLKDGKIPHFTKDAVDEIILEAKRRSGKNKLTLCLRDLGGLVRAAGDIAKEKGARYVTREHVLLAKKIATTIEQQLAQKQIELKKEYRVLKTKGYEIGRVNGLAVIGDGGGTFGGLVLPIEARVVPAMSEKEGKVIATGKLGEIAREAVENVSAIIKDYAGVDISSYDIHIQFLQTYEGVEGDSASISVATAVISSLEKVPIAQDIAMTGSLSIKGEVLPIGGINAKIEAAYESGINKIIVPAMNKDDIILDKKISKKIKIYYVKDFIEVLKIALKDCEQKKKLISKIKKIS